MFQSFKVWLKPWFSPQAILKIHQLRARLAAFYYHYPGQKLKVIGVTGTNGKTTTCFLISAILKASGAKTALATTVEFQIGEKKWPNPYKMTTVSPFKLQQFLAQAWEAGCEYAVIEVTSHALEQFRTLGINFWGAVFTNLTHDHLDYHQTFKEYLQAKLKLFQESPQAAVINLDDPASQEFLKLTSPRQITYGLGSKKALIRAEKIILQEKSAGFALITPQGQRSINLKITGKFNIYNALAASGLGLAAGVSLDGIKKGLEAVPGVRGRMEEIFEGQPFQVILDYAHTPDALEKLYQILKPQVKGRLIAVFGATGNRDKTKRPILGAIASRLADIIILTNEDPYTEDPGEIIKQVGEGVEKIAGFEKDKNYFQILDRRQAIQKALGLAQKGDWVIITGKGHEEQMAVRHPKNPQLSILKPFNERMIVSQALAQLGYSEKPRRN